jgi:hypothetical protein
MSWFEKIMPSRIKTERRTRSVPEGLWIKCPACDAVLYRAELERNLYVCPKCSHHMRIGARERLRALLDPEPISEIGGSVMPDDPLKFKDSRRYRDRLAQAQKTTRENDALVALAGQLHGEPVVACAFEFQFLGGSMGSVVGERFKRSVDFCIEQRCGLVCFTATGGFGNDPVSAAPNTNTAPNTTPPTCTRRSKEFMAPPKMRSEIDASTNRGVHLELCRTGSQTRSGRAKPGCLHCRRGFRNPTSARYSALTTYCNARTPQRRRSQESAQLRKCPRHPERSRSSGEDRDLARIATVVKDRTVPLSTSPPQI